MGNLNFSLGRVEYDTISQSTFPLEAQIGVGAVASLVVLIVVIIVLIYRWVLVVLICAHILRVCVLLIYCVEYIIDFCGRK